MKYVTVITFLFSVTAFASREPAHVVGTGYGLTQREAKRNAIEDAQIQCDGSAKLISKWSVKHLEPYEGCPSPYDVPENCIERVEMSGTFECL